MIWQNSFAVAAQASWKTDVWVFDGIAMSASSERIRIGCRKTIYVLMSSLSIERSHKLHLLANLVYRGNSCYKNNDTFKRFVNSNASGQNGRVLKTKAKMHRRTIQSNRESQTWNLYLTLFPIRTESILVSTSSKTSCEVLHSINLG